MKKSMKKSIAILFVLIAIIVFVVPAILQKAEDTSKKNYSHGLLEKRWQDLEKSKQDLEKSKQDLEKQKKLVQDLKTQIVNAKVRVNNLEQKLKDTSISEKERAVYKKQLDEEKKMLQKMKHQLEQEKKKTTSLEKKIKEQQEMYNKYRFAAEKDVKKLAEEIKKNKELERKLDGMYRKGKSLICQKLNEKCDCEKEQQIELDLKKDSEKQKWIHLKQQMIKCKEKRGTILSKKHSEETDPQKKQQIQKEVEQNRKSLENDLKEFNLLKMPFMLLKMLFRFLFGGSDGSGTDTPMGSKGTNKGQGSRSNEKQGDSVPPPANLRPGSKTAKEIDSAKGHASTNQTEDSCNSRTLAIKSERGVSSLYLGNCQIGVFVDRNTSYFPVDFVEKVTNGFTIPTDQSKKHCITLTYQKDAGLKKYKLGTAELCK